MKPCIHCGSETKRKVSRYCSNKCQNDHEHDAYISEWKQGKVNGSRGVHAKNISGHLSRFLFEKFGNACTLCGWDMVNAVTNKVPLEIDHIDGNSDNNAEDNLRVICPNCHSLTVNYRNLNKGNGRGWRRLKYLKS